MQKTWTDQPDEVVGLPTIVSTSLQEVNQRLEVRGGPVPGYYVTTGNLFGSQTVHVEDGDTMIRMLGELYNLKEHEHIKLSDFPGAKIVTFTTVANS